MPRDATQLVPAGHWAVLALPVPVVTLGHPRRGGSQATSGAVPSPRITAGQSHVAP